MERLFDGKVYLEVWVRVKSGWTDDERLLRTTSATNNFRSAAVARQHYKVDAQPAFVLHTRPYRETSLIVIVFSAITVVSPCWHAAPADRARYCAG